MVLHWFYHDRGKWYQFAGTVLGYAQYKTNCLSHFSGVWLWNDQRPLTMFLASLPFSFIAEERIWVYIYTIACGMEKKMNLVMV